MNPKRIVRRRLDWTQFLTAIGSIAAVIVAIAALLSTSAANRDQQRLSEQGQVTDRFGKSVEQLGSEILGVRLGGIYGLERIMRDSKVDEPAILEVLCAFVRDRSLKVQLSGQGGGTPVLETDVQAVLTVVGRRPDPAMVNHRVDLSGAYLSSADLSSANLYGALLKGVVLNDAELGGANLESADLTGTVLDRANLGKANLSRVKLIDARLVSANLDNAELSEAQLNDARLKEAVLNGGTLTKAILFRADLTGARLIGANLTDSFLERANLTGANLSGADLTGANLNHADLSGADLSGANLTDADLAGVITTPATKLPR